MTDQIGAAELIPASRIDYYDPAYRADVRPDARALRVRLSRGDAHPPSRVAYYLILAEMGQSPGGAMFAVADDACKRMPAKRLYAVLAEDGNLSLFPSEREADVFAHGSDPQAGWNHASPGICFDSRTNVRYNTHEDGTGCWAGACTRCGERRPSTRAKSVTA